ncbi:MAG: hypothetical protein WKF87_06880 [Chryseolinea sp.]
MNEETKAQLTEERKMLSEIEVLIGDKPSSDNYAAAKQACLLAAMWLGRAMAPTGSKSENPDSDDPETKEIEPRTDRVTEVTALDSDEIYAAKGLRAKAQTLEQRLFQDTQLRPGEKLYQLAINNAYSSVCEITMWMNTELEDMQEKKDGKQKVKINPAPKRDPAQEKAKDQALKERKEEREKRGGWQKKTQGDMVNDDTDHPSPRINAQKDTESKPKLDSGSVALEDAGYQNKGGTTGKGTNHDEGKNVKK